MPQACSRRILLAVSGMSPQIITETLYALITEQHWIPDEIRLITTVQGSQNAVLNLLEGERHFHRLLQDYQIDHPIQFSKDSISVIQNEHGNDLNDLRTPEDNQNAADLICQVIREITHDPHVELHVSLAGGRKTMGFYAGYALSLFGRPQDRLSHVLVSEHYESNRDFFYPTPTTQVIYDRDGKPLDTSKAKVWLAEIPFVGLRKQMPLSLLSGHHSFSETVSLAREATERPARMVLIPKASRIEVNGHGFKLSATQFVLLLLVVERARKGKPPLEPILDVEMYPADELLNIADSYWMNLPDATRKKLEKDGITQQWLEQNTSRLNKTLTKHLGVELAECCKLASRLVDRHRAYTLPDELDIEIDV